MNKSKIRRLTTAALMGAIAFVLMFFSFSIPFLSPFAEFDASSVAELIGGFILGPLGAIEIITVKIFLKIAFKGTTSMFTGEIQNFLLSTSFVLPAVWYYRKHRTKKGAVVGLILGSTISIVMSVITNIYLIFPAYMYLYGMNWESIVEIFSKINPMINNIPTIVAFSIVPFNIISRAVTSVLTMLLYKKISVIIKQYIG